MYNVQIRDQPKQQQCPINCQIIKATSIRKNKKSQKKIKTQKKKILPLMLFLVKGMANGERRMPDLNGASYQRWVPKGEALQWQRASDDSFGREEMPPFWFRLRRNAATLQHCRASEEKADRFRRQSCGSAFR